MLRLRIDEGGASRFFPIPDEPIVLGRGEDVGIRIEEKRASRAHLVISPAPGGVIVRDLDSTNGTFVGERRISQTRLFPGDAVRVGDAAIALETDEAADVAPRRRVAPLLLGMLAPALLLFVVGEFVLYVLASSRAKELARAEAAIEDAEFLLARSESDPKRALAALNEFLRVRPGAKQAAEATRLVTDLRRAVSRSDEARREMDALLTASGTPAAELMFGLLRVIDGYSDVPEVAQQALKALSVISEARRGEQDSLYLEARREAEILAGRGEFGPASSALTAFVARNPAAAAACRDDLRRSEGEIYRQADEAFQSLADRAAALARDGKAAQAAALLRDEAARFTGMRYAPFLRRKAESLMSAGRPAAERFEKRADDQSQRRAYDLLAAQAEELAAARMFGVAADRYAELILGVTIPDLKEEFTRREKDLRDVDTLLRAVQKEVAERGREFGGVELRGGKFLPLGLEGDRLDLEYSGQKLSRPWSSLAPEETLAILRKSRAAKDGALIVALYCALAGLQVEFEAEIVAALGRDDRREAAGALWARRQGLPYPEGGFLAWKGRALTRKEYAEEAHKEQIAALRDRQRKLYEKIRDDGAFRRLAKLRDLRADLDKARDFALALIFDEVKYFYPYKDRMAEYTIVQREVDARVAAVRKIWDDPIRVPVKASPALDALVEEAKAVTAEIRNLGADSSEFETSVGDLTMYLGLTLGIREFFFDSTEREFLEYDRKVMEANRVAQVSATPLERRQVEVTNEYRVMMGRRALALDDLLVKTARGHSDEMAKEGYFSHFSPHPDHATPELRAKIQGYKGNPLSENIHAGSGDPEGAHNGWLHSSGHHRNILQKFWTDMATGHSGRYWTQNFGRTKPMQFPN